MTLSLMTIFSASVSDILFPKKTHGSQDDSPLPHRLTLSLTTKPFEVDESKLEGSEKSVIFGKMVRLKKHVLIPERLQGCLETCRQEPNQLMGGLARGPLNIDTSWRPLFYIFDP